MKKTNTSDQYRQLPSVDEMLRDERIVCLLDKHSRTAITDAIRTVLEKSRCAIADGAQAPDHSELYEQVETEVKRLARPSLRRAVNATGVILHTNLGRSTLCQDAVNSINEIAQSHSTLEMDVASGKRGSRQDHVRSLLTELTGAESALVVNNNAAAVLLAVNTLAQGASVIISRGQLVEIGGSFRMPDIIKRAGANLVEVGTTNRTRIADYENAFTDDTALILRCHPSNFKISGFVEEASLDELVDLAQSRHIPMVDDLGSGALLDISTFGMDYEPTVMQSVKAGASIVCFSGDKLLGGPQAGILVGKSDVIDLCRKNPLARALRVDKFTLAALEATLRVYRYGDPWAQIPTLAAISRPLDEITSQAKRLSRAINSLHVDGLTTTVEQVSSEIGGGSLPGQSIKSCAVALKSGWLSAEDLGEHFRGNDPPVFGRIAQERFLLDMRTVTKQEVNDILGCVKRLK
ncbi:L-seryl-tRNA(Sec) selenium transferase [bacterium]|nr:L-seryl-tRNA(Sec) selenium transferase [bacterium]